jgi:hypothetical protein
MRDVRKTVVAVCIALLVVGGAATAFAVAALIRGVTAGIAGVVAALVVLSIGVLLIVILSKDPAQGRDRGSIGARQGKAVFLRFTVGAGETHRVEYRWDQMWGWVTVTVDGVLVLRDLVTFTLRLTRVDEFEVGESEKHRVRIEKRRPLLASFARPQPITAFVDGVGVPTAEGVTSN